jgi:hypothetical protein
MLLLACAVLLLKKLGYPQMINPTVRPMYIIEQKIRFSLVKGAIEQMAAMLDAKRSARILAVMNPLPAVSPIATVKPEKPSIATDISANISND